MNHSIEPKPPQERQRTRQDSIMSEDDDDDDSFFWNMSSDDETPEGKRSNSSRKLKPGQRRKWLASFLGLIASVGLGSAIFALPAILTEYVIFPKSKRPVDETQDEYFNLRTNILLISFWMACVWAVAVITHFIVDSVPGIVLRASSFITGAKSEVLKTRLENYVAVRRPLKAAIISACALLGYFLAFSIQPTRMEINPATNQRVRVDRAPVTDFNEAADSYQVFFRLLALLFIFCMMYFIQSILLQKIAIGFHYTAYHERLKENKFALKVLDKLGKAAKSIVVRDGYGFQPPKSRQRRPSARSDADSVTSMESGPESEAEPSLPRKRENGLGSSSSTMDKNIAAQVKDEIRGNFQGILKIATRKKSDGDDGNHFSSTHYAKKLARRIFTALNSGGRRSLTCQHFLPHFKTEEDAKKAFAIFDKDGNGDISAKEMRDEVKKIYKERTLIQSSLRDVSEAVGKLEKIMLCLTLVLFSFVAILVFGGSIKSLVPFSSMILAGSFLFGGSAKNLFECIIFLFVTHPFDTGDRVYVTDNTGSIQNFLVSQIGLLTTLFKRADGQQVYVPNNVLAQKFIHNIRRSPAQSESIDIDIAFDTPAETIHSLHARMKEFVIAEFRDYMPSLDMVVKEFDNLNKVKLGFWVMYKSNWQDGAKRWARRTKFVMTLKQKIMELGIVYALPPQRLEYAHNETIKSIQ